MVVGSRLQRPTLLLAEPLAGAPTSERHFGDLSCQGLFGIRYADRLLRRDVEH